MFATNDPARLAALLIDNPGLTILATRRISLLNIHFLHLVISYMSNSGLAVTPLHDESLG